MSEAQTARQDQAVTALQATRAMPPPSEDLKRILQEVAPGMMREVWARNYAFALCRTRAGQTYVAASGRIEEADLTALGRLFTGHATVVNRAVNPAFVALAAELGELATTGLEGRIYRFGPFGAAGCAEKKLMTQALVDQSGIEAMLAFCSGNPKFLSYMPDGIRFSEWNYMNPCESCMSSYMAFLDMRLEGWQPTDEDY